MPISDNELERMETEPLTQDDARTLVAAYRELQKSNNTLLLVFRSCASSIRIAYDLAKRGDCAGVVEELDGAPLMPPVWQTNADDLVRAKSHAHLKEELKGAGIPDKRPFQPGDVNGDNII